VPTCNLLHGHGAIGWLCKQYMIVETRLSMRWIAFSTAMLLLKLRLRNLTYFVFFRDDDKFGRRERYSGPTSEFKEKDGYKPNVKLDYIDDDGHVLNAKEAFR